MRPGAASGKALALEPATQQPTHKKWAGKDQEIPDYLNAGNDQIARDARPHQSTRTPKPNRPARSCTKDLHRIHLGSHCIETPVADFQTIGDLSMTFEMSLADAVSKASYFPENLGVRFSENALKPSLLS